MPLTPAITTKSTTIPTIATIQTTITTTTTAIATPTAALPLAAVASCAASDRLGVSSCPTVRL